jgi:Uma2 family endonuclease
MDVLNGMRSILNFRYFDLAQYRFSISDCRIKNPGVPSKIVQSFSLDLPVRRGPLMSITSMAPHSHLTTKSRHYNLHSEKSKRGSVVSTFAQSIPPGKIVLTYDDYCELPNDRNRYEVLDGELSVAPAPTTRHQMVLGNLHRILANHIVANQLGDIYAAPTDLILAPTTVVQPDLIFVGNDRRHIVTERAIEGPPTLLIEILSLTTHRTDRVTKAQLYAKHRVPHYWLIDPDQRTLEAYELVIDHYDLVASARDAEVFAPSLFPGLSIQLSDLWA